MESFLLNYILVKMVNLLVDCDCCSVAEDPCMKDAKMLASLDPFAIDHSCIDLIYNSKEEGRDHIGESRKTTRDIYFRSSS